MSGERFKMITKIFYVSDPEKSTPNDVFTKLEPLNTYILKVIKE